MSQIRAVFIAVFLVIHGIYIFPAPRELKRDELGDPPVVEELDRWYALIDGLGLPISRDRFEDEVVTWSARLSGAHRLLKVPFKPMMDLTGTGQGWALFAAPDTHPQRLVIEGRRHGGDWEMLYRRIDPEHALLDPVFRYRRVRGVYDGTSRRAGRTYKYFTRFAARRVFEVRPDLSQVRVVMVRYHTTLPWQDPDPLTVRRHERRWKKHEVIP